MTTAVSGLLQPTTPEEKRRRRGVVLGAAATSVLSLLGGIIFLLFSGQTPTQTAPLKPRSTPTTVASAPPTTEAPASTGDLLGAMGANFTDTGVSGGVPGLNSSAGGASPLGGVPLSGAPLSPLQLPSAPQGPAIDWGQLLEPSVQAQQDAIAAGLTGAITGPVVNAVSSGFNSSAILLGDIILYAAYTNNGGGLLNQLQTAIPAAAVAAPTLAAAGAAPAAAVDFSGLTSAFAAASALPSPVGLPALPQLPPLPTPEQVLAGLSAIPAISALQQLPPPPPLPTPEQALAGASAAAAAMGALAALLPPPPPIGLPSLPPIGLPPIGLPSFGLPSITRLLGLPF